MKKRLTRLEEFEIMKLVLDKFLWLGFGIMIYGLYVMAALLDITKGIWLLMGGAIVLLIFLIIIVKEYEVIK
jgi:hypothetical protein